MVTMHQGTESTQAISTTNQAATHGAEQPPEMPLATPRGPTPPE